MKINRKNLIVFFIHTVTWLIIVLIPFIFFGKPEEEITPVRAFSFFFRLFLFITLFYSNYLVFIPHFLSKRKFILYAGSVISSIAVLLILNYSAFIHFPPDIVIDKIHNVRRMIGIGSVSVFLTAISTSIRVTQEWYNNEKQKNIIQNEKLNSELSFLKSQINPHFLFNTLNNIYSLANRKSEHTAASILKLSHLMRYMLYDAKKEKVDLRNEIDYLIDYIELQKLRIPDKSKVIFNIEGNENDKKIEPLLLVPFVENAFKHGDIYSGEAKINILLRIKEHELMLKVTNPFDESGIESKDSSSGVGLENLKKRLELLYPNKHEFFANKKDKIYTSILKINLKSK